MSNPDSFIEEVTEELRRDRLFRAMRRYGWIVILAVVVLVGATAFLEWRDSRRQAAAEALGARIDAALNEAGPAARAAALGSLADEAEGDAGAVVAMLAATEAAAAGERREAAGRLARIAGNQQISEPYRRIAALRQVMMAGEAMPVAERRRSLEGIADAGGPLAPLALEQLGLLAAGEGDTETALARLREAVQSASATPALRQRALRMIVALGGSVAPA